MDLVLGLPPQTFKPSDPVSLGQMNLVLYLWGRDFIAPVMGIRGGTYE